MPFARPDELTFPRIDVLARCLEALRDFVAAGLTSKVAMIQRENAGEIDATCA